MAAPHLPPDPGAKDNGTSPGVGQAEPAPMPQQPLPQQPLPQQPLPQRPLPHHKVKRTRIGGVWLASGSFAVLLLLLLIFILENSRSVDVAYFGAHGHLPLGVALLLAAVLGVLLVVIPGTARIVQLRVTARRHRRADARQVGPGAPQQAGRGDQPPAPPGRAG